MPAADGAGEDVGVVCFVALMTVDVLLDAMDGVRDVLRDVAGEVAFDWLCVVRGTITSSRERPDEDEEGRLIRRCIDPLETSGSRVTSLMDDCVGCESSGVGAAADIRLSLSGSGRLDADTRGSTIAPATGLIDGADIDCS